MRGSRFICACLLLFIVFGLLPLPKVEGLTNNGITLSEHSDAKYGGTHVAVSSSDYSFEIEKGDVDAYGTGAEDWNLTRSTGEQVLTGCNWLIYVNGSAVSSSTWWYYVPTVSSASFTDSLGSGVKLNVTQIPVGAGTVTVYQVFKFYPSFFTMQFAVNNTYSSTVRQVADSRLIEQSTYGLYIDTPANVRWTGMAWETGTPADILPSSLVSLRTPSFWYSTASDKGLVLDEISHKWDWVIANSDYQNNDPSNKILINAYVDDRTTEYVNLSQYESTDLGTLFVQLTGNKIDEAYETLGSVYTTLYAGRGILNGFSPLWSTWSAYSVTPAWTNVKADVDYLDLHSELGIKVVQLDHGWQLNFGNWTSVHSGFSASDTLQTIINYIKSKGFKVGLWVAPWRVGTWALTNATVKSWLLNDTGTGNFKQESADSRYGVTYYLNPTISNVRTFVTNQLDTLVSMGVEYFKFDFLDTMGVTQKADSEKTRATWLEYSLNISEALPKGSVFVMGCLPVDPYGFKQPYYAQKYYNLVRFSWDTTDFAWTSYVLPSYKDYHVISPLFNYLTVKVNTDMFGDDALYGNSLSDAEWCFSLFYHGASKTFEWSNNFATGNTTKIAWVRQLVSTNLFDTQPDWRQGDYWLNSGVNRIWYSTAVIEGSKTTYYVAVFNPTDSATSITVNLSTLELETSLSYRVTELLEQQDLGMKRATDSLTVSLGVRDAQFFVLEAGGGTTAGGKYVLTVWVQKGGLPAINVNVTAGGQWSVTGLTGGAFFQLPYGEYKVSCEGKEVSVWLNQNKEIGIDLESKQGSSGNLGWVFVPVVLVIFAFLILPRLFKGRRKH